MSYMRWLFITKYTNICYKHHNIHITVSKPAEIIKTVEKMNDNYNEGDNKIAGGGRHFVRLPIQPTVNRTGCHK